MTFTFTFLLCLGLTLGLWIPELAWTLPKPILRVQPESVVSKHTNVTLLCEGARGAKQYHLYKLGSSYSWPMNSKIPLEPGNKAEFSISKVESHHAGLYHCYYHTEVGWSEDSEAQELVVTGIYSKPRLSVQPSPIATPGENVTLQCVSKQKYDRFILTKEGPQKLSWMLDSWYNNLTRQFQALFSVGPVTISQRWIFRCYSYHRSEPQVWSEPSEPLDLLFSGTLQKPTIKSESGSIIASGSPNTIWCQGTLDVELYVLHKEGSQKPWIMKTPEESGNKAKFSIPSVTQQHGGQYRCYCYSSAGWLEHSDTLELVVTGIHYYKPSLSVLPSPVVTSGRNMTLQCVSWVRYEKFILTKENEKFTSSLNAQYIYPTGNYQVLFSMENMTPDHAGIFRCYGYYKNTPHLWSVPSEPLEIHISGPIGTSSMPPLRPMSTAILEMYMKIRTGVSMVYLLFLFIFILLLRKYQGKFKMYASKETELQLAAATAELVTRDIGLQKRKSMIGDLDYHLLDTCPCQLTSHCLSKTKPASATNKERFRERKRVMGREMSEVSGLQK